MGIQIGRLEEHEIPRVVEIHHAAYYSTTGISAILYYAPPSEASRQQIIDNHVCSFKEDPTSIYLKAVDEDSQLIVACAKWHLFDVPRTAEEIEQNRVIKDTELIPEFNEDVYRALFQPFRDAHANVMGPKPHMFLSTLVTHPDHERRGCGGMLLQWGLEKADEYGLDTYLDATRAGNALYKKHGFQVIQGVPFDLTKWGITETVDHFCMIRPGHASESGSAS